MNFEEKTVSSEEIYDGKIIKVRKEKVELSDGRLATRELIGHPGGVGIIAVDGDGKVFMVTQYRIAAKCLKFLPVKWSTAKILWNVVQGSLLRKRDIRQRNLHISANITQHRDIVKKNLIFFLQENLPLSGKILMTANF